MSLADFTERRKTGKSTNPRPDYAAIARMELEIFGKIMTSVPGSLPGSPLCPCEGTLPRHLRSSHYLPGYDAGGLIIWPRPWRGTAVNFREPKGNE